MAPHAYMPAITAACYLEAHPLCSVPECECPCHRKADDREPPPRGPESDV